MPEAWEEGGFGLYLHWPFCRAKCPYCDFNSHVAAEIDQTRWRTAYLSEIDRAGAETGPRPLRSVFFGGGTPSLMEPGLVAAILERARETWPAEDDLEVTLEANPTSVEAEKFRGYREAGVDRVSVGVQALRDPDLRALGRTHSAAEARAAVVAAHDLFSRVSFDLIYARQAQCLDSWRRELGEALEMAADHLSLYQLTVEPGTVFGERLARGRLPNLPDENHAADMFNLTQELCEASGMPAYEISNHAAPGAESRHNLIYWTGGDYVGIGPGAHGRVSLNGSRFATETPPDPATWLRQVETEGCGESRREALSRTERLQEVLMMGLRLNRGIDLAWLRRNFEYSIKSCTINMLTEIGLLDVEDARLRATSRGRLLLNAILREILPEEENA